MEEDPGFTKHCCQSINQLCHPALDRPNAKLGLINRGKGMQQLLFYSEKKHAVLLQSVLVSPLLNSLQLYFLGCSLLQAVQYLLQRMWSQLPLVMMNRASVVYPSSTALLYRVPHTRDWLLVLHCFLFNFHLRRWAQPPDLTIVLKCFSRTLGSPPSPLDRKMSYHICIAFTSVILQHRQAKHPSKHGMEGKTEERIKGQVSKHCM